MAERLEDQIKEAKQQIIGGIIDSSEKKLRTLQDLSKPLPQDTTRDNFSKAVDELSLEGVLPLKPAPRGYAFDYNHTKAKERGYV
mgnify:CR=1 FL=1